MVTSVGSSTSGVSNWSDSVFSKLDTKKQGYIEKSDLDSALSATGESDGSSDTSALDDMFSAIDGDSDGKVTKSELSDAMTRVSDQLNAQFDASRVQGGMPPGAPPGGAPSDAASDSAAGDGSVDAAGGMPPAGGMGGMGGMGGAGGPPPGGGVGGAGTSDGTDSTDSTDSTSTDYVAAADTDGDGTVSEAEQAAYDKKLASGEAEQSGNSGAAGGTEQTGQKDSMRDLARALHMLKAYADNGGSSDSSTASTASTAVGGVSVEA